MPVTGEAIEVFAVSPRADSTIRAWTAGLVTGTVRLWQLPQCIEQVYWLGHDHGRASREDEVRAAKHEADRQWLLRFTPRERQAYLLERLDRAAELMAGSDVDNVLDAAWRAYLDSLDTIREQVAA